MYWPYAIFRAYLELVIITIIIIVNLQFIDRENEINALDSLLMKKAASLILLYGRRAGRWPWRRSGVGLTTATQRGCSQTSPERLN
jgi:hypothetical protein